MQIQLDRKSDRFTASDFDPRTLPRTTAPRVRKAVLQARMVPPLRTPRLYDQVATAIISVPAELAAKTMVTRVRSLALKAKRRARKAAEMREHFAETGRHLKLHVPPTGIWGTVSIAPALKAELFAEIDHVIAHSLWGPTTRRAARVIADHMEEHGLRFELTCRELSKRIGSKSTSNGWYHLNKLTEAGFISTYRDSYLDWDKMWAISKASGHDGEIEYMSTPTVRQLSFRSSDTVLRASLDTSVGSGFYVTQKLHLTCEASAGWHPEDSTGA